MIRTIDHEPISAPAAHMTEAEFLAWCEEDTRAEWVDGEVIVMSPANFAHVNLNRWLLGVVGGFVDHHNLGAVVGIEYMIRFGARRRRRMPDVLFVSKSRMDLVKTNHLEGAPDLIMEIVSPDSQSRDWREKYLEYESAGVREYWVFDPASRHFEAYALIEGSYRVIEPKDGKVASEVLKGFYIRPEWIWNDKPMQALAALKEMGVA